MGVLPPRYTGIARAVLLVFLIVAFTLCRAPELVAQQTAAERQAATVTAYEQLLRSQVDAAERVCLSNTSSQQATSLLVVWRAKLAALTSGTTIEKKTEVFRGAARSLPDSTQLIENDKIRNCMNKELQPIFSAVISYLPTEGNAAWPEPIDFRFNFIREASRNSRVYTDKIRLELKTRNGPKNGRLVPQDP